MGSASSSSAKGKEAAAKLQNTKVKVVAVGATNKDEGPAVNPPAEGGSPAKGKDAGAKHPDEEGWAHRRRSSAASDGPTPQSSPAPPSNPMPGKARPRASPGGGNQNVNANMKGDGNGAYSSPRGKGDNASNKAELARRKKLQEQEEQSLAQMSAAQYQAFEKRMAAKKKKLGAASRSASAEPHQQAESSKAVCEEEEEEAARRRRLQEQEELSLDMQMAQKFRAMEKAGCVDGQGLDVEEAARRRRLLEQEEASMEQQMAQQYRAFEAIQKEKDRAEGAAKGGGKTKEEQEELSIDMMNLQQYKAYEAKMREEESAEEAKRALQEADDLMNNFAPPSKPTAAKKPKARRPKPPKDQKPQMQTFSPDSGDSADRDEISEVLEGKIFLTNYRGVENVEALRAKNIKHIVCVNSQENMFPDQFKYFNIDNLEDQEDHDATEHFASVKNFTDDALHKGGAVCFHCAAGISRSATMVIAYLMASQRMTLLEAFATVYHHRRVSWPNRSFMKQLISYENQLNKRRGKHTAKNTISIAQWDKWTAGE